MIVEQFPKSVLEKLSSVSDDVSAEEIDAYAKRLEAEGKIHKLLKVLSIWEKQQDQERALRRQFANALKWALFVQIACINLAFIGIALGWLEVDEWVAKTFIIAVFGEVAAMTFTVVRYLFPDNHSSLLEMIKDL